MPKSNLSDFWVCHRGMFDKEKISKLKKGVLIVNNARGAIMDTQAVADACTSGHIAGNLGAVPYKWKIKWKKIINGWQKFNFSSSKE